MLKRKAVKTLLIVGEGQDEVAFLNHVKQFPGVRGNGWQITIRNAKGKGAAHVIDVARRHSQIADYDGVAAWFDTDTDWNVQAERVASKHRIQVVKSEPCLEALLLRVLGKQPGPDHQLKDQLAPFVDHRPAQSTSYKANFAQAALNAARASEITLDEILQLFRI